MRFPLASLPWLLVSLSAGAHPDLINGTVAAEGELPFVVTLGFCTATKVGPRHFITAAHCFHSGPGSYRPLRRVMIQGKQTHENVSVRAKVRSQAVHPSWLEACRDHRCTGHETGSSKDRPGKVDLFLLEVEEETPGIPWIDIHFEAVEAGTEVTLAGYGCHRALGMGMDYRLRYGTTRIGTAELLKHDRSLYRDIAELTTESYSITPGAKLDTSAPALCPGDSGGPLLARIDGAWKLVGVASDYTFAGPYERTGSIPMTNLHTRLDDGSLHRIGEWIREFPGISP